MLHIGTAGWAIRREHQTVFPGDGSHLARYARVLNTVEINSSFYRPHRASTYAKWEQETPKGFSFAVKMPRAITHDAKLRYIHEPLQTFFGECGALGEKLGCILIQLPPSLAFDAGAAREFLEALRGIHSGRVALEPRHASWFTKAADTSLTRFKIARVAADPIPAKMQDVKSASVPGGWDGFSYWRLHGSPKIYCSDYDAHFLKALAARLSSDAWVIFDNTALGHATENALALQERV
jgi:uncharacterized protein YecE (DUF72 family)